MKKLNLKLVGLVTILAGVIVKAILQHVCPNGILIDLCRLSFFVGLAMFLIGLFRKKATPSK